MIASLRPIVRATLVVLVLGSTVATAAPLAPCARASDAVHTWRDTGMIESVVADHVRGLFQGARGIVVDDVTSHQGGANARVRFVLPGHGPRAYLVALRLSCGWGIASMTPITIHAARPAPRRRSTGA